MRLLHRHDDKVREDADRNPERTTARTPARDPERDEGAHRFSFFGFHRERHPDSAEPGDDRTMAADRNRDRAETARRDAAVDRQRAEAERERADDERRREEIVERRKRWDTAAFLTAGYGAALAVMGSLALVRTGVDASWYRPVVEVAGIDQSPMLGAIELGAGAVILITLMLGLRAVAALATFATGIAATVVAIEPSRVNPELAIQRGWAVALAVVSLALGLLLVGTRDRRRERRVIREPATA